MADTQGLRAGLQLDGWRGRGFNFALGALAVLGHAPFHLWIVTLACLAVLALRLDNSFTADRPRRAGFGTAFWFAFGYFLFGMYWIGSAFLARGPEYIPLIIPLVGGLIALMSIIWGVAGAFYVRCQLRGIQSILGFTSFFFIAEYIRGHLFGGFPWNLPGYIFEGGGVISQSVSLFGVYGLSCLVFLISALFAASLRQGRKLSPAIAGAGILAVLAVFGFIRLSDSTVEYVEGASLRIVQVDFDQKDKFNPEKAHAIVNQFITESLAPGIEDITHLIWPEGAVDGLAINNPSLLSFMGGALTETDNRPPYWLINSLRHEQRPDEHTKAVRDYYYNSSAVVSFDDLGTPAVVAINDKQKLVPFGEFIPGGDFIQRYAPETLSTALASITPAHDKLISQFPGLPPVSPQVCFEIVFSGLTPKSQNGLSPEWILNQSNDGWYGNSIGPRQHANIATFRAIEEGLPVVRAASNGISGVIDPYGRFVTQSKIGDTGVLDFQLPKINDENSQFVNLNLYLLLINMLVGIQCIIVGARNYRH